MSRTLRVLARPFIALAPAVAALAVACGSPPASLPTPFASYESDVGRAEIDTLTMTQMVLKYSGGDAAARWATWSALMEREGYTWDGTPSNAMGMTFDTFTHPNGDVRKLIVTGRGGTVYVHMSIED